VQARRSTGQPRPLNGFALYGGGQLVEWFYVIAAFACIPIAAVYLRRKKRIEQGKLCWNCGVTLVGLRLHVDRQGRRRCPKCGNEVGADDGAAE